MMKQGKCIAIAFSALVSFGSFIGMAAASESAPLHVNCTASYNYKVVLNFEADLNTVTKNQQVATYQNFVILLSREGTFSEVQVYSPPDETRNYARGKLSVAGDSLQLASWKRNYLFEVTCAVKN